MSVLCIIPARGGSKGVKDKNITTLHGKPLIAYSIETALEYFNSNDGKIIVSTDSDKIADIAKTYKQIEIDHRPTSLAQDDTHISNVINHILHKYDSNNIYSYILLLQPTAPIRETFHIKEAIQILNSDAQANAVISVCMMDDIHPARMYKIDTYLVPYMKEFENFRRQDLPPAYVRNGSIYLCRKKAFLEQKTIMAKPSLPYAMDKKYYANIDDEHDLIITKALIENWLKNK